MTPPLIIATMFGKRLVSDNAWGIAFLQDESLERCLKNQIDFKLKGLANFEALVGLLRSVGLMGDKSVKVYEHCQIQPKRFAIENLSPLALYALESQLAQHKKLFWHLSKFGQNLFDLAGVMEYSQNGQNYRLAPPIVETYIEPTTGQPVTVIIDGLHRVLAAKQLGFDEVWAIEVSDVPNTLLPIALPVTWSYVVTYGEVPKWGAKRLYRYKSPAEYPTLTAVTGQIVTNENYQYFLYRDFSVLGSSGVRTPVFWVNAKPSPFRVWIAPAVAL